MKKCEFCCDDINEEAKRCKTCGEPIYFVGKVLKFTPLFSFLIAVVPCAIALMENIDKHKAMRRAEIAENDRINISRELNAKERASDMAISEIASRLPEASKNEIIRDLRLPARTTIKQLEQEAKTSPENSEVQKNLYLFRALKKPGQQ